MTGKTVNSSKKQSPIYSMRPKTINGAFYEDLAKVTDLNVLCQMVMQHIRNINVDDRGFLLWKLV